MSELASSSGAASSMLLDSSESRLRARALRTWPPAQQESLRERFATVLSEWQALWIPERVVQVRSTDVRVGEPEAAMSCASDNAACWSFVEAPRRTHAPTLEALPRAGRDPAFHTLQAIADAVFSFEMGSSAAAPAAPAASKLASAIVHSAWADWLQRIGALMIGCSLDARRIDTKQLDSSPASAWSGALQLSAAWCGGTWRLALPYEAVAALVGKPLSARTAPTAAKPPAPTAPLAHALGGQHIALRVMLEGAQLSLGQLQQLRIHDIVPLAHSLDAPAFVVGPDGARVCDGWLGRADGRMAIELAALPAPAASASSPPKTSSSQEVRS